MSTIPRNANMFSLSQLAVLATLAVSIVAEGTIVPPASQGEPDSSGINTINGTTTDTDSIVSTATQVDQKSGPKTDTPPNLPPPPTTITAVDGDLVNTTVGSITKTRRSLVKRSPSDYEEVFSGTGTGFDDRDASIEGTGYLTYTLVDNSTYSAGVGQCLDFCDRTDSCVFVNMYYEYNNPLLDWVFSEKSNLKCALYSDVHVAAEKTNRGGQQLEEPPHALTYVSGSTGYAKKDALNRTDTPDGYDLVFGPTDGANEAPGFMGFLMLDRYDVQACADICSSRNADSQGGGCSYFNIWRAVVNDVPTTYTCALYYLVTDESTATNHGQYMSNGGHLQVTLSRGYARKNFILDGGFEEYNSCSDFCFTSGYDMWKGLSPSFGYFDATIFHYAPYARTGHGVALLGSADARDPFPGVLTPSKALETEAGKTYSLQFWLNSDFSGPYFQASTFVEIHWNGKMIDSIKPGYSHWTFHRYDNMVAQGNDVLQFQGGKAPAWNFIDDVKVYLA